MIILWQTQVHATLKSIYDACDIEPAIVFRLLGTQDVTAASGFDHTVEVLNNWIGKPGISKWNFGHTHVPWQRWLRFLRDKQRSKKLKFTLATENVDISSDLESILVAYFKDDGRQLNFRPGGGWTSFGHSPFFVYVALY